MRRQTERSLIRSKLHHSGQIPASNLSAVVLSSVHSDSTATTVCQFRVSFYPPENIEVRLRPGYIRLAGVCPILRPVCPILRPQSGAVDSSL